MVCGESSIVRGGGDNKNSVFLYLSLYEGEGGKKKIRC